MEAGSWDMASASFSDALHNSQGDAKNLAAQYLAAVMLCKVWTGGMSSLIPAPSSGCALVMSGVLLGCCRACSMAQSKQGSD